ncbi:chemotaxis protein CheW [Geomicrobium sp. JSM 1781026]|uniref:chemotaxis protein CheW n=1 Tax=Geomicrobium sp. JSM 1781026 TaxID=3344580 RepID=UPI0035C26DAA
MTQVIVFTIDGEKYGIDVDHVQSVERVEQMTRVPGTAQEVLGVMNMRGAITTLIDLRIVMGKPAAKLTKNTRLLLLATEDDPLGVMVDEAREVIQIEEDEVSDSLSSSSNSAISQGVVKRGDELIFMIDATMIYN